MTSAMRAAAATQDIITRLLALGLRRDAVTPAEWRDWRWVLPIAENRICFYAEDDRSGTRLVREAALLAALDGRLSCEIPTVLAQSADGRLQVRRMVRGKRIVGRELEISRAAGWEVLAASYGTAIASLHAALDTKRAVSLVTPAADTLPYPAARIRPLVERFIDDLGLARVVAGILDEYAAIVISPEHRVLLHGDVIAANMTLDLTAHRLVGLFDFSDASVGDRHRDLNYVHSYGTPFARRLMDAYEDHAGIALDRRRPAIYHVASAISHLVGADAAARKARVRAWVREIIDEAF